MIISEALNFGTIIPLMVSGIVKAAANIDPVDVPPIKLKKLWMYFFDLISNSLKILEEISPLIPPPSQLKILYFS